MTVDVLMTVDVHRYGMDTTFSLIFPTLRQFRKVFLSLALRRTVLTQGV